MAHAKTQTGPRPPATTWIPAVLLGLGINALAASVMAIGAGAAMTRRISGR